MRQRDDWRPEFGTEGEIIPGTRAGLPDHLDGIPVKATVRGLVLSRRYDRVPRPLPMAELREDGDGGSDTAARWPEPFPNHALGLRQNWWEG